MGWIRVSDVASLRSGAAKRVTLEGRTIALFNVGGTVHATDDECPHEEGGSLARGTVEDGSVWCPLHGARFALATGETLEPPEGELMTEPVGRGVCTYPVMVAEDGIYVEL
jgi:3-phenylpropionate/trans-cinnamate dioxygenase ferredoxin component